MGDCGRRAEGQDKGWVKGRIKGGQGAGLPIGVPTHHLQKHNKRTKETTCKRACGGEWKVRGDWGGRKIAAFAKKGGQGVEQGAGLPMGVPP